VHDNMEIEVVVVVVLRKIGHTCTEIQLLLTTLNILTPIALLYMHNF
jgi:hypothetical protein